MSVTATLVPLSGTGRLLCADGTGDLLYERAHSLHSTGRLLYDASVATRIVGTAQLAVEGTSFRHNSGTLTLYHGYNSSASLVQADADAVCPPSSTAYSDNTSTALATANYSVGSSSTSFRFRLWLQFLTYPLANYWYRYIPDVPVPYRVAVASLTSNSHLYIPSLGTDPFSGLAVRQHVTNPVIDYAAGTGTVDDIWGPAARAITAIPTSHHLSFGFDSLASRTDLSVSFVSSAELDLRLTDSGQSGGPTVTRNLCLQSWFASVPVGDGVTGTRSREFQFYTDSVTAEIALYVAGDQRTHADAYASAYNLT